MLTQTLSAQQPRAASSLEFARVPLSIVDQKIPAENEIAPYKVALCKVDTAEQIKKESSERSWEKEASPVRRLERGEGGVRFSTRKALLQQAYTI